VEEARPNLIIWTILMKIRFSGYDIEEVGIMSASLLAAGFERSGGFVHQN